MKIIVCLDERNGMLFNRRRQSSDQVVCQKIIELAKDSLLWMNIYSGKLFSSEKLNVTEDFLAQAGPGEYCFVENTDVLSYRKQIEKIYVFRWNRVYPADTVFPETLLVGEKVTVAEFPGKSHAKITLEVYSG
jgi:hypothetical protein